MPATVSHSCVSLLHCFTEELSPAVARITTTITTTTATTAIAVAAAPAVVGDAAAASSVLILHYIFSDMNAHVLCLM